MISSVRFRSTGYQHFLQDAAVAELRKIEMSGVQNRTLPVLRISRKPIFKKSNVTKRTLFKTCHKLTSSKTFAMASSYS